MKWMAVVAGMALMAGCGADGEPVQPTRDATISLSGSDISGTARVGLRQGPVSVSLGLGL